jgi:hypothetical protein
MAYHKTSRKKGSGYCDEHTGSINAGNLSNNRVSWKITYSKLLVTQYQNILNFHAIGKHLKENLALLKLFKK